MAMPSDSLLTALPPCPTSLDVSPKNSDAKRSNRKSQRWRLSRKGGARQDSITDEIDTIVERPDTNQRTSVQRTSVQQRFSAYIALQAADARRPSLAPTLFSVASETKAAIECAVDDMDTRDTFERQLNTYDSDDDDDDDDAANDLPAEDCEDDRCRGPEPPVWHCVDCDSSYCSECWPLQGPHKPKKKGRDGVPHEKTDPRVVRRLKAILSPSRSPDQIQQQHVDDEATKWFGVIRDATGRPVFEDYGRYASLLASISPIETTGSRYPQLVSFIGVTNAGKSTLIKMLVNHDNAARDSQGHVDFPSPIVGSIINDSVPTSGDVHLYADPSTHAEQLPMLYADCEGFEGGERTPLGARARRRNSNSMGMKQDLAKLPNVHTRPIEWAVSEEQRQREYAVTALYPRLLYTFSDCVVFVLRNPKTFQSAVLTKLLDWGVCALEKSINQPALPHCVVALNGTDPAVDDKEWDIHYATQSLLSSVKGALDQLEGVPRFRELAQHWRSLGKHIYSVEDLILRYYSSFKVIRIPAKPRYMLINEQVAKLHATIKSNCEESFKAKRRARMLTNADELNTYLQSGFDHFTTHLDIPFNFMQISLLRNPIPNDFGGHILQLLTTISRQQPNHQPGRVAWMFEKLSVMLASCVLLDCARFRKGRVDELFTNYEKFFDYALGEYLELHFPCAYVSPDGSRQCMLVKARHQPKGHQDEKGIIAAGDYEAAFEADFAGRWKTQLRGAIHRIQQDYQYELDQLANGEHAQSMSEEKLALDLHLEYVGQFYETVGPASSIVSHATCFCCLMDVSEHPLPCGHVLCSACIKAYGRPTKTTYALAWCPLHKENTRWPKPVMVRFKPSGAGARVLCLDGGGIRGIVQLEVLRAIEQILGGYVDVQAFFDLIVGTGTGGMLSVALALRERTVDSCIDQFKAVCEHAFTPRLKGIPLVTTLAAAFGSGRRYKTKPLLATLKTAFTPEESLFGASSKFRTTTRVALTTTSATGQDSILLASYRRPEDLTPAYHLERPHEPDMEIKIWEAVAASVANPAHFRAFSFRGKTYLDGGVRMPNPSFIADRERRLIWPDVSEPDIFLSLGTGQHRMQVLGRLSEKAPSKDANGNATRSEADIQAAVEGKKSGGMRWRAKKAADDVLDAEVAWLEFRDYAVRERSDARGRRYVRLNPDLEKEPPASDSKNDLESVQLRVRKGLQLAHRVQALRNVAHRLVASSFYLELQSKSTAEKSEQVCTGSLYCRFEDGSVELAALGKVLEDRVADGFQPYFHIRPNARNTELASRITITRDVIRAMTETAVFAMPTVHMPLRDETKASTINLFLTPHDGLEPEGFTISNMPRVLLGEKKAKAIPRRPTKANLELRGRSGSSISNLSKVKDSMSISEHDTISLNGANSDTMPKMSIPSSEDSWQGVQARMSGYTKTGTPKMSLADIIAQSQGNDSSVKQRTNRFWTYIGNNHMALNPELYSPEELKRHAANETSSLPLAAFESPARVSSPPYSSLKSQSSSHTAANMLASPPSSAAPSSQLPDIPQDVDYGVDVNAKWIGSARLSQVKHAASVAGTDVGDEVEVASSNYSGQEAFAKASPLVQLPASTYRTTTVKSSAPRERGLPPHEQRHPMPPVIRRQEEPCEVAEGPLQDAIDSSLPSSSAVNRLEEWLTGQKASGHLPRKSSRLRVVNHDVIEESD